MNSYGQPSSTGADIAAAKLSGNISTHDTSQQIALGLSESSREAQLKQKEILRRVELEKKARSTTVPTLQDDIKAALRRLGKPILLFGEGPGDVRDRLKLELAELQLDGAGDDVVKFILTGIVPTVEEGKEESDETLSSDAAIAEREKLKKDQEVVYTTASQSLIAARAAICSFSLLRAGSRLASAKRRREPGAEAELQDTEKNVLNTYRALRCADIAMSAVADDRPVTDVQFTPDGTALVTCGWTGNLKIWNTSDLTLRTTLTGHTDRATSVAWRKTGVHNDSGTELLASGSADKSSRIWKAHIGIKSEGTGTLMRTLDGHADRITRVEFHPYQRSNTYTPIPIKIIKAGAYLGTASMDHTWRLWDIETGTELLLQSETLAAQILFQPPPLESQDGHGEGVSTLCFQNDGSLVATADHGGSIRFWDLRSGQCVWSAAGHIGQIVCSDFSPSGFEVATGSVDHTVRLWDVRRRLAACTLPAHSSPISSVRYSSSGEVLATSSFDNSVKLWGLRDLRLLRTLRGHDNKVSSCDIDIAERRVVSCSFDRTIKSILHDVGNQLWMDTTQKDKL